LWPGEVLDPLLRLEVPFDRAQFILGIDQTECVAAETVHVTVAVGSAPVGKQDCHLLQGFGRKRPEIPHHVRGLQIVLRIALLRMDEIAEL